MTSKLTREENVQAVFDLKAGYTLGLADVEILKRVARMALAALDSELVAWAWHHLKQWHVTNDEERVRDLVWDGVKVEPLYRHAQQPVVPDAYVRDERGRMMLNGVCEPKIGFSAGWNACRAAMLQAGNSPVITDGYVMVPKEPTEDMIAAAMNCDDVRFNSDESFCVQFGNIYEAMLAAAPQEQKP